MALRADKLRALVSLIDLVVENSAVIQRRRNVTTFRAATRFHRYFPHLCSVVTLSAFQIGMSFMLKRGGGDSGARIRVAISRER